MASQTGKRRAAPIPPEASSNKHPAKKTRFVDPSEDPANFAEQVDSALENPSRKGKVKNEGYDSDSSDDGEGVVESRKKDAAAEDNDDMFAMGEDDKEEGGATRKKDRYMRLGDIEGQEFGDNAGSEMSDDDEPEDEDAAIRKAKAGMGYEISAFNMREEMDEGKFTEEGSYVRTFDPHDVHDRWMEGLNEREFKKARKRQREQNKRQQEIMEAEERELQESGGKASMEKQLLAFLKKGETVLEALQRLGTLTKKQNVNSHAERIRRKPAGADGIEVDNSRQPTSIEQITHLASAIMSLGETDIYSRTYEEIVRSIRSSGNVDKDWIAPSADVTYEYKWDAPESQSTEIFGPFSENDMMSWYKALYFGSSGEKIKLRKLGGEWGRWDDVVL